MRCFTAGGGGDGSGSGNGSRKSISSPPASAAAAGGGESEDREHNQIDHSPSASSARPSLGSDANSPNLTPNIRREYTRAVQTDSYNEIWSKIHRHSSETLQSFSLPAADLIDSVLQPDRSSIQEALSSARFTPLTRLVSQYLDSSERASHLFLSLRRSVDRARSLYAPIADLLDILSPDHLSQPQCDWAFDTFQEFDGADNPFPAGDAAGSSGFDGIRSCFVELKQQLDSRLVDARRRQRLLRCATRSSAYCLIASAAATAVAGLVIAAHAVATLAAAGPAAFCCGDLLATQRRRLHERMAQVDAAARETYVLNNNLDTIERLVARLRETVESDKGLVRLVLERGRGKGQRHPIQEVVRHLRKNHSSFTHQLRDLDEHIVLCLAAVNRARSLLIHQIHR